MTTPFEAVGSVASSATSEPRAAIALFFGLAGTGFMAFAVGVLPCRGESGSRA